MKEKFKDLLEYNDWANRSTIDSIINMEDIDQKIVDLFSHIISAQIMWLMRITKDQKKINPWEIYPVEQLNEFSEKSSDEWNKFVEEISVDEFKSKVTYKNTKGNVYENSIEEILTHVINHSSYHRAQIAMLIRNSGEEPAVTDYIVYKREG